MQFGRRYHGRKPLLDKRDVGSGADMLESTETLKRMMVHPPIVNNVSPRQGDENLT